MKLNTLYLQALKEKYFVAFMLFVLETIDKFEVINQRFPQYVARFKAAYDEMNHVYLKYDVDFCTEEVQKADTNRDTKFTKLRNAIRATLLFNQSEEKTQAAEKLLKITDLYGGASIVNQGMTAQTATIVNLIEDFEEKYAPEVATIGIGEQLSELKQAQKDFDEKYMRRAECDSEISKGAMAQARKNITKAYRDLVTIVNLEAQYDTEEQLDDFIKLMNVEIGKYRTYTGQGQVGAAGSGTTEKPTPTPPEDETPDNNSGSDDNDQNTGNGENDSNNPGTPGEGNGGEESTNPGGGNNGSNTGGGGVIYPGEPGEDTDLY